MSNLYTIAKDYADEIIEKCETLDDAMRLADDYVNTSRYAIYPYEAWELVGDNLNDCEDAAENMGADLVGELRRGGVNAVMCALAGAGLYEAVCGMLHDAVASGMLED